MRQTLFVLILLLSTEVYAEKLKVFVTPNRTEPVEGELVNYSLQTLNSVKDVQNKLKKDFIIVSSRSQADFIVLIIGPQSTYPQPTSTHTVIRGGFREGTTTINQHQGVSIPLRWVFARILVDGKDYETDVSGLGIWTWRSAAKEVAQKVRVWAALNHSAL